jgi:hypothetical protein
MSLEFTKTLGTFIPLNEKQKHHIFVGIMSSSVNAKWLVKKSGGVVVYATI